MTTKQFYIKCDEINAWSVWERDKDVIVFDLHKSDAESICQKLNEIYEEKEFWKSDACSESGENQILWNEIHIMITNGAEPTEAFQNYRVAKRKGIVNCRFA